MALLSFRSIALWILGYPDRALAAANHAITDAREIGQAATLMYALNVTAITLILCGHYDAANAQCDEAVRLAEDLRIGNQYRFILPGPEISSADQERCLDQLSRAAAQADYIVASGSLPIGVPEDFYARVAALAKRQAKRLVLDTSGAALKQAGHGIYLLKPSLRELEDLTGRQIRSEREEEQAAREVVAQGRSEVVVVSLGPRGALLASAEGSERFPAMPMQAKSTVGAGDSMLAGIVLDLYRGLPLREAVRFGMAAGAAALLGSGTQLCRLDDVERLYAQMSVTHPATTR